MTNLTLQVKEAVNPEAIQRIESMLVQIEGVERALVDTDDGEIKIEYNEKQISAENIQKRVKEHGLHLEA
ncbi:heavy metal-associated domain-containing protein [Bacillus salipaludis]|uniref:heavy-metal-associated domain-containing protein n=1 Tax=Bacillus salipaludis TaxID=2547811 RepID=UPI003D23AF56